LLEKVLNIGLIETVPESSKGSMRRYANLVEQSFEDRSEFQIHRFTVSEDAGSYAWCPSKAKTLAHHLHVYQQACKLARLKHIDVFHVIDGSHGYLSRALGKATKKVVTVHDVIPKLQSDDRFRGQGLGRASKLLVNLALRGISDFDVAMADSQSTALDLRTEGVRGTFPVIHPPLEPDFLVGSVCHVRADSVKNDYVFHIGNNGFYKNRAGVLEIYATFCDCVHHRLKMAGPEPTSELLALVAQKGIEANVDWIVNPSDSDVVQLYQEASLLLFPSIYEGFGWPPIEAMACGCPVVCSNAGSLPEVVGDAALTHRYDELDAMANSCLDALNDLNLRQKLVERGVENAKRFSLEKFGDELAAVYKSIL
jgi:glycosyltransferase involved in cell wall biosynthesis